MKGRTATARTRLAGCAVVRTVSALVGGEAIVTAGRTRLRPSMMTTLAMIFGMLLLALVPGAGGEMRAPMALAVIGGLVTSILLTLLVVPVVCTLPDDLGNWIRRKWIGGPGPAEEGESRDEERKEEAAV
jgi:hydrophobic/amphiphilic exporter-1 (mainly G- bacteria), HAE1 family